jgi:hypothetical protein
MQDGNREGLTTADLSGAAPAERESGEDPTNAEGKRPVAAEPSGDEHPEPLLGDEDTESFQARWRDIQVRFVDEPRDSVKDADGLVAELMQRLAGSFSEERNRLESEWERGSEVSTEDLRVALKHYRSFFNRLLSA